MANNPIEQLSFDTKLQVGTDDYYPIGENLHYIFTTNFDIKEDSRVQFGVIEKLKAMGIDYETLVNNTITIRSGPNAPALSDQIEILEAAQITPPKAKNSPIKEMPGKAPKVAAPAPRTPRTNGSSRRSKGAHKEEPTTTKTPLEIAREKYCNWASTAGTVGVSEMIQKVEPKEDVDNSTLPNEVKFGSLKVSAKELLTVKGILMQAGELDRRGVHGYIPLGTLDKQIRQQMEQSR